MSKLTHIAGLAALALMAGVGAAASDQPVGEAAVEAVVIGDVVKPGRGSEKVEVPFLLLKDGRAYQEEAASPLDFLPSSRPFGSWGVFTWARVPGGYRLTAANGGTEDLREAGRLGPDGARLEGTYRAGGDGGGRSWSEVVSFDGRGSYRLEQSQSMQGGGMMGGGGSQWTGNYRASGWTITTEGFGRSPERKLFAVGPESTRVVVGAMVYRTSTRF